MKNTRRKSRILDEVQETARGLHDAGLISQARMEAFDALHREAEDAARLRALRAAVDVGIADIEAGLAPACGATPLRGCCDGTALDFSTKQAKK